MKQTLMLASILLASLCLQAQGKKTKRFSTDNNISKYIHKPISAYKEAVYFDAGTLITEGALHLGAYKKISKKNFVEAGAMFGLMSNTLTKTFLQFNLPFKTGYGNGMNNSYYLDREACKLNFGVQGAYNHALFGNTLSNNISIGIRAAFLSTKYNGDLEVRGFDSLGNSRDIYEDTIQFNMNTIRFNPVLSGRVKLTNTLQIEGSGILSILVNSADLKGRNVDISKNPSRSSAGVVLGLRIIKLL
jgi:hypothetical protein